jgi:hypothetical protein
MNTFCGGAPSDPMDLDLTSADRLLDGLMTVNDAPAGYEDVVRLVDVIRTGVAAEELIWEPSTIGQMIGIIRGSQRRCRRPGCRLATAAAATTLAAVISTSTAAAAGVLPGSLQVMAHGIAAHLGLSVPRSSRPQSSSPELSWVIEPVVPTAVGSGSGLSLRAGQPATAPTTSASGRPPKAVFEVYPPPPTGTAPRKGDVPTPGSATQPTGVDSRPFGAKAAGPPTPSAHSGKARTTPRGKSDKTPPVHSPHCSNPSCRPTG